MLAVVGKLRSDGPQTGWIVKALSYSPIFSLAYLKIMCKNVLNKSRSGDSVS